MIPCFFYPEYLGKRGRWNKFDEHVFLTRCFNHLDSRLCLCFFATGISVLQCRTTKNCCPLAPTISRWGWLRTWDWWVLDGSKLLCVLCTIFGSVTLKHYVSQLFVCQCLSPNSMEEFDIEYDNQTQQLHKGLHTSLRLKNMVMFFQTYQMGETRGCRKTSRPQSSMTGILLQQPHRVAAS